MLTTGQCQSHEGVRSGETSCRGGTLKNEALALEGSVSVSDEVFPSRQGSTDVGVMASASPIPTSACLCSSHRTSTSGLTLPSDKQDCQTSESQQQEFFDEEYSWVWDCHSKSTDVVIEATGTEVYFHPDYSCGTSAVRGERPLGEGEEHYWEVKMSSAVYGTDMMIGVGTANVNLNRYRSQFCSLIGKDNESWGISYFGTLHHDGKTREYTKKFERGSVIGCHLDLWKGTLSFYKNGEPLGVAFEGLLGKQLYPIISSTAARTRMKLVCSYNTGFSLQYLCCREIGRNIPCTPEAVASLSIPNAMKRYLSWHMDWVFKLNNPRNSKHGIGPRRKRVRR